jgi:hypothetical protein
MTKAATAIISGPRRKFCEGIVSGLSVTEAYRAAYPKTTPDNARKNAAKLTRKDEIKAEIAALRAKGDEKAGSAVLTYAEKRAFCAHVVRCELGEGMPDADLIQAIEVERRKNGKDWLVIHKVKVCGKLDAIKLDNDLAGDGKEAESNDALAQLLERVMK